MRHKNLRMLLGAALLMACLSTALWSFAAVHTALRATQGMVAADHALASAAGVTLLRQGGNAVDAVCAATFAQSVVSPAGSGIGGGGFALIKRPSDKQVRVVDFREVAPAASTRTMYLKKGLSKFASRTGGLAVAVPGEVKGCAHMVKQYGKKTLAQVLQPAIALADKGFPVGEHLHTTLVMRAKMLRRHKNLAQVFYPKGKPLALGQILKRPRLAKTFRAIAKDGPRAFYQGWIAKDIVQTVKQSGGILTLKDLANYKVKERNALHTKYRGLDVYTMPPPSSGGIAMIQTLNILRRKKLAPMGQNSSQTLFFLAEALQHAFADRARYLGDTDFVKVPVKKLTSQAYADTLAKRIGSKVQPRKNYGSKSTPKAAHRDGGTSHISTIDKDGMSVALTTTINTSFGSKVLAPLSGIVLNNEMDDFSTKPGKPNAFGLVQSANNEITPGKRPLSSMSPTLVLKQNKVFLSLGASGGPAIITSTLQTLINVVDFRLELADALSRTRIHHQWLPPILFTEKDMPRDVSKNLAKYGHRVVPFRKAFTAVQAVQAKNGALFGASDPRKHGSPAGY